MKLKNSDFTDKSDSRINPIRDSLLRHINFNKNIVKATGPFMLDEDGNGYLDFLAQFGALPFGSNPSFLWDVVNESRQANAPTLIQPFFSSTAENLAQKLVSLYPAPMDYVAFSNSGAESVEVAIKLARAKTKRKVVLSTENGFHGKTLGALSATGNEAYKDPFLVDTTAFEKVSFNDCEELERRLKEEDVAAFIVELVQGEGGMICADKEYITQCQTLCRKYGTLFVIDEIQTGLGRTGKLFGAQNYNAQPDIVCLAKALGGGIFPIGATLYNKKVWTDEFGELHSSTFANNHLSCSIGSAVIEKLLENGSALIKEVDEKGEYLRAGLEALIKDFPNAFSHVTGMGLMQGIYLLPWSGEETYFPIYASNTGNAVALLCGYLLNKHNIITSPGLNRKDFLRIEPPLTITYDQIDTFLRALRVAGRLIHNKDISELVRYLTSDESNQEIVNINRVKLLQSKKPKHRNGLSILKKIASHKTQPTGRYAFLIHPPTDQDLLSLLTPHQEGSLDDNEWGKWCKWLRSYSLKHCKPGVVDHSVVNCPNGETAEGWLIGLSYTAEQLLRLRKHEKEKLLHECLSIAKDLKVNIVGLGAFFSVISRAGSDLVDSGVPLTTGNSLTAISSVVSLKDACEKRGKNLSQASVAVIGAGGSVGAVASKYLNGKVDQLILMGNPSNPVKNLEILAGELYQNLLRGTIEHDPIWKAALKRIRVPAGLIISNDPEKKRKLYHHMFNAFKNEIECPVLVNNSFDQILPKMDCVLSATSMPVPFIHPGMLADDSIFCDVARPSDLINNIQQTTKRIYSYEGGLMHFPEKLKFGGKNILYFQEGINLACFAETVTMSMDRPGRSYSIGTNSPLDEAEMIFQKSLNRGFKPHLPPENDFSLDEFHKVSNQEIKVI